jgi:geranylgeranyl transferase type-1 subunit beta
MATDSPEDSPRLNKERHLKYWKRCHSSFLPTPYTASDSSRLTFACFIIAALDLLSAPLTPADRIAIRRWVMSLQHPDGGFCGSSTHTLSGQDASRGTANLAASFFALVLLGLAADGEDEARNAFAGVNRTKLLRWMRSLQREDGSFGQNLWEGQSVGGSDMRHSYLASCVRWMLRGNVQEGEEGWVEDVNVEEMVAHIRRGQVCYGLAPVEIVADHFRRTMEASLKHRSMNLMVWHHTAHT